MPRTVVHLITDEKYHIYNRGTEKRDIFLTKGDYLRFYRSLNLFNSVEPVGSFRQASRTSDTLKRLVDIEAYALLSNHFHFILKQNVDGGISEFMKRISGGYTSYFNELNCRNGSLFQGTFKRVHIESSKQFLYLFAYVNENHTVHGLGTNRELYQSSSIHFQGLRKSTIINSDFKGRYSLSENIELAQEICAQRENYKKGILE